MKAYSFYIIIPSFNQGQFVQQTIDSILDQSVPARVIVMDGGSSDQTTKILKSYGDKIYWHSKPDKGQTDAINQGLALAFTEIKKAKQSLDDVVIAYINSDDYYLPGAFSIAFEQFQFSDKNWLAGGCQIVDADGTGIMSLISLYKQFFMRLLSWSILLILNPISQPAVFIRASAIKKTGNFTEHLKFAMDYEYWLRLWQAVGSPLHAPEVLAAFRVHGSAKGSTGFQKQFDEQLHITKQYTNNQLVLFSQKVHNALIVLIYSVLK
ncbi:MAG: glycosyltransferase [bacterium]|nr:glycosyltransferase [bacterium]